MKKLTATLFVLALAMLPALARAGSIPIPAAASAANSALCSAEQPQFCVNGTSSSATSLDALRVSLTTPRGCAGAGGMGQRTRECDMRGITGTQKTGLRAPIQVAAASGASALLAADQQSSAWGLWASYGKSKFEGNVPGLAHKADLDSVRVGADRAFGPRYVLGAALSYERMDTTTPFNGGGQDSDAYMLMPYGLFIINDTFTIDVNGGVGKNDVKQNRISPTSSTPGAPRILRSSFDGTRYFGTVTLTGSRRVGDGLLGGRIGYLEAREHQDGYRESGGGLSALTVAKRTLKLGQAFAALDAGYAITSNLEPYISGVFRYDTRHSDGGTAGGLPGGGNPVPGDRSGVDLILGVRFFGFRGVSGYAEVMKVLGRENFEHKALNLLVRFDL